MGGKLLELTKESRNSAVIGSRKVTPKGQRNTSYFSTFKSSQAPQADRRVNEYKHNWDLNERLYGFPIFTRWKANNASLSMLSKLELA